MKKSEELAWSALRRDFLQQGFEVMDHLRGNGAAHPLSASFQPAFERRWKAQGYSCITCHACILHHFECSDKSEGLPYGASAIQCCYAAIERCKSSTLTNKAESRKTTVTFCSTKKCIVEEKISLNVSRLEVNPACIAGVLTSRPNLSAL